MPTDEWFKENPKVTVYLPPDLNEKLLEWMKGKNIQEVSQALRTILEEYLGGVQTEPNTGPVRDDRLEALERKFESLSQMVQELKEAIQATSSQEVQSESKPAALPLLEGIATIEMEQPIKEEIQDDEPDEILHGFLEPEEQKPTEAINVLEGIATIEMEQPIEEEIQDDEPDEILYQFLEPEE